ncbi:hypothetical protein H311_02847 [Anncaliia algerae PRA109]|nr:hypothetical protein H311_02847 [Anncaliia algerae PRA109]
MYLQNIRYQEIQDEIFEKINKSCNKCGAISKIKLKKNLHVKRCPRKHCGHTVSIWENTIFKNSKLSFLKICAIIDLWILGGKNSLICKILLISKPTLTRLFKIVFNVAIPKYYASFKKLGGSNIEVEIDKSKFGKRKYNKGHKVEGVWIFGMVERSKERKILVIPVEKRNKKTLTNILLNYVEKDSIILSDCWKAYSDLFLYFKQHKTVNHTKGFKNDENGVHTNTIEGNWFAIKSSTPNRCRNIRLVSPYLLRFMLKRNQNGYELKYLINLLID